MPHALIIGSSDGIGLALTRLLLERAWTVTGLSRSPLTAERLAVPGQAASRYHHVIADVCAAEYADLLDQACTARGTIDACIYCTGIGELLDLSRLERERAVFATNLMGLVITVERVLPHMLAAGSGHFVGLSSQADGLRHADAPSYNASKAGFSAYLESLALAVRPRGVAITNVRFGFVDTKMSDASSTRPFLISPDHAARLVLRCLERRPIRFTYPKRMAALLWLASRLRLL